MRRDRAAAQRAEREEKNELKKVENVRAAAERRVKRENEQLCGKALQKLTPCRNRPSVY